MSMVFNASVLINAVDRTSHVLRRIGRTAEHTYRQVQNLNRMNISSAPIVVLRNMQQRLNATTASFREFNAATNAIQAHHTFTKIEKSIARTRRELSLLGFGKTKAEIQALEGQLYNLANVRMDNLRDQIKLTERALEQMKKSADASKYAEEIKKAEAALASYKKQLQDVNAVQKMAEVNGYNVMKAFGKDVFVKPLEGFQRFKAQVTGFFNADLAMLAGKTYKTIDGAAKAIVGATDTIQEQRRKVQQLATTYQTLGTTINTMVTPFILGLGAAFAYVGAKAEQAYFKFEAQTLTPRVNMKEYKNAMADVYAETGQAREEVSKVFAFLKNKYDLTAEAAKSLATKGADFADVWASGDAQSSIKAIETMRKTMRLLSIDEEQAANALALAMKRTNGDWEEAAKSLTQYGDVYKKLVTGQKITEDDARAAAERNVAKAIREQSKEYIRLQREKKRLEKQRDATKDKNQKAIINQAIANVESDMKRMQENLGKNREEMLQREIKMMMQLQELDPLNAYQNMGDAEAGVEAMAKAWRNFANVIEQLFDALGPTIEAIGNKLTGMTAAATEFLRNNPGFATFVSHILAGGAALTVFVGLLAPLAYGLLFSKDAFLALGLAMKGMQAGAMAVLPPRVVQMAKRFDMFRNAIIGLPKMLAGLAPALATAFRVAPLALAKFVADFVKLNPMLTAFSLLATVIIDNWERVGPLLKKIWEDIKYAFKPVLDLFRDANGNIWPKMRRILEEISRVIGDILVGALQVIEPLIRGIAQVINGDFNKAAQSFEEAFKNIGSIFDTIFKNFDLTKAIEFGLKIGGSILDGITKALSTGLKKLFELNVQAVASGDVGKIATALTADLLVAAGAALLAAPAFRAMKAMFSMVGGKEGAVSGGRKVGAIAAGTTRTTVQKVKTIYETVRHPRQAIATALSPLSALAGYAMAGMGISSLATARQRQTMRQKGLGLNTADIERWGLREGRTIASTRDLQRNITQTGRYNGRQIFMARQSYLSRMLFGQKFYTYQGGRIQRDANGNIMRDASGAIMYTHAQRNLLMRRGGLFNRRGNDDRIVDRNIWSERYTRARGAIIAARTQVRSFAQNHLIAPLATPIRNKAQEYAIGAKMLVDPVKQGIEGKIIGAKMLYDSFTGSRFAKGARRLNNYVTDRMEKAGLTNHYANMFRTKDSAGNPLTRRQQMMNFVKTGVTGTAKTGFGIIGGTARRVVGAGRMVGKGIGMAGSGIGMLAAGAMAFAPWLAIGALAGGALYKGLSKGADGKSDPSNVAKNIDKITMDIQKNGGNRIRAFWKVFTTEGPKVLRAVGNLIKTTFQVIAKALPPIMQQAWNWIKSMAGAAWNWIKTNGLTLLSNLASGAMSLLGKAWNWVKTDGIRLFGLLIQWLLGTALPGLVVGIIKLLKGAWEWVKSDGMRLLGELFDWIIFTALPTLASSIVKGLLSAFTSVWEKVKELFGQGVETKVKVDYSVPYGPPAPKTRPTPPVTRKVDNKEVFNPAAQKNSFLPYALTKHVEKKANGGIVGAGNSIKKLANGGMAGKGGIVKVPTWVGNGEAIAGEVPGQPEMVIPLHPSRRARAISLWQQTARLIGIKMFANGGIAGSSYRVPFLGSIRELFTLQKQEESTKREFSLSTSSQSKTPIVIQFGDININGGNNKEEIGDYVQKELAKFAKKIPGIIEAIERKKQRNNASYRPGLSQ